MLDAIVAAGDRGRTRDELCELLGLEVSSVNPRVHVALSLAPNNSTRSGVPE